MGGYVAATVEAELAWANQEIASLRDEVDRLRRELDVHRMRERAYTEDWD